MSLRVTLLCEDLMQEQFLAGLARARGWFVLRRYVAPSGAGAASAWVSSQFVEAVRRRRAAASQEALALLVAIDGDNQGCAGRKRELERLLRDSEQRERLPDERIALLVPTWSVGTWFLYLAHGKRVPESEKSKHDAALRPLRAEGWQRLKRPAMEAIVAAFLAQPPAPDLPALMDGYQELARLA